MTHTVLIVAGGKGLRMGSDLPKQFLPIGGKPVLMHTIEAFHHFDRTMKIILVLPQEQQTYWQELCAKHSFVIEHTVVDGGETRFHSVKNGLACVNSGLVGVHDGVRPFVSPEVIKRCYELAAIKKAVIPVIDVVETVRHITETGSETVSRNDYKLVQTPQVFDAELLKQAYAQEYTPFFTDDASVVEAMGVSVCLAEGNRENIKITTPFDLKISSALVNV
ncbi:2-C-methyl-D-erythritol 4-phosphate cytidylyltransferase [Bacteroides nordii]|jgi:2-C-methyl-D-erythritol 4-phosphate cytidylyltransferase|uniref:2-C-methyl-D-erythritol 4-phosphate cytidylyltransferase n=1 Tax=Bacteroides TaxID=816 RepID=UPI000370373A|nr:MULTISPECIES: 2-C-methyl-D-erythritol 4-phosphate cytidylyltransferase [Bacteroides]OKZ07904.1 MAG: 2-C-methyl-D-erythritol 4-phosphate cytidylyltransferase [Bacteroides sp. 41_26]EOA52228.1 2-C-methyl-D-erythritol 4-phosphate cytidylyltransferase [Bacteroides sp. HPS0048]MCE8465389.1 2-C-methyl-D-erythritol 4-phosphate cytidylyltransferase [Bacteroides nordii]UAK41327.1 2-C-methyl-D-erythritol 4-phosphate cytidylyltransferase [Bacteroides nordii]UYU47362.1 2-C-methyl-D-erythritol 4-phospha